MIRTVFLSNKKEPTHPWQLHLDYFQQWGRKCHPFIILSVYFLVYYTFSSAMKFVLLNLCYAHLHIWSKVRLHIIISKRLCGSLWILTPTIWGGLACYESAVQIRVFYWTLDTVCDETGTWCAALRCAARGEPACSLTECPWRLLPIQS